MQVHQQNRERYQYLQSEIDKINQRELEDKRRVQLEVIPIDPFVDSKTGQLDNSKFEGELEKRMNSNVSVEEIRVV